LCIKGIKENCKEVRRVIVVSTDKYTNSAEWFDEKNYPFDKNDIGVYLNGGDVEKARAYVSSSKSRVGWYYQQLLKFYAPFVIDGISSNVLLLDSDTIFLKTVKFTNSSGGGVYNTGIENTESYFEHADKLSAGKIKKIYHKYSGICHHMLIQRCVLDDLFSMVESIHQQDFWKAFCSCVDKADLNRSGASEYEIYFNFVFSQTNQVEIRQLKWKNLFFNPRDLRRYKKKGYDYVSCHTYITK